MEDLCSTNPGGRGQSVRILRSEMLIRIEQQPGQCSSLVLQ